MEDLAAAVDTWTADATAIEPVGAGLETTDVTVVSLGLVWVAQGADLQ